MIRFLSNRWVQIILLLLLLAQLVVLRMQDPSFIHRWRQLTFDAYNRLMPRPPGEGVMIVDIDEVSLRDYGQWPWPRPLVAQISDNLYKLGAKVIAFDMVFAEPDRTSPALIADALPPTVDMLPVVEKLKSLPDNDQVFANKIAVLGNVITGFSVADQPTRGKPVFKAKFLNEGMYPAPLKFVTKFPYFAASLDVIGEAAAGSGSFTALPEQDSVIRQVPLLIGHAPPDGTVKLYPALPLEALRVALGKTSYIVKSFGERVRQGYGIQSISLGDYTIPTDKNGNFYVYYAGHRPDLFIPAWKVLSGDLSLDMVKNKIVFIGTSAVGLKDLRASPLNAVFPGVEVHAEIIEQILSGKYLNRPDFFNGAELCAAAAVGLLIIFLTPFIGLGLLSLLVGTLIAAGCLGSLYAYQKFGYLLDPVYPSLSVVVIFLLSAILTNLRTEMERRAVKIAFSHYISPVFMEELASNPEKLKLGGEVRELSVMFTDIRNFTTIAETMDPADLIKMINDFLTPMTSCVMDNRGTIDKYMGDAMMAFWNAPLDDPNHARSSCKTALLMKQALKPVNEALRARAEQNKRPFMELKAGIGINTGRCSVGNMGSEQRFAYSALGDTVNLASRLESQTKSYGVGVLISSTTRQQAPEFAAIEIDLLAVKGRSEPERVFALLGDAAVAGSPAFLEYNTQHEEMLAAYRGKKWDETSVLIEKCQNLWPDLVSLYDVYRQRIADIKSGSFSPGANWRGVWVAKDK
ncbi:MAG: adenylate/guanylate cyclase domain-containing protein [Alphaproteobacteria bacterium]|nr:adenylate/guanylate cyclase domain-containing protein [Alphaproteobacteria bacterium]